MKKALLLFLLALPAMAQGPAPETFPSDYKPSACAPDPAAVCKSIEKHRSQLEKYEALCNELGQTPANVALAWLLHQPGVTAPILGPRSEDQLTSVIGSVDLSLSKETLERLDQIWPGPGGTAPEAYAW